MIHKRGWPAPLCDLYSTAAVEREAEGQVEQRNSKYRQDQVIYLGGEGLEEREQRGGEQETAGLF